MRVPAGARPSRRHACRCLADRSAAPPRGRARSHRDGGACYLHAAADNVLPRRRQASRCPSGHDGIHPPVLKHGPRSLTSVRVIYLHGMRRTERAACSHASCESPRGRNTGRVVAKGRDLELEHICWDPKGGDLCLNRMKPRETLVEVRSDVDVQITRLIWV